MAAISKTRSALTFTGRVINDVLSFVVFSFLDILDFLLCYAYKVVDFFIEAEWKPCYCSSPKRAIRSRGKILVSEQGESKIVCLSSSTSSSRLQLEEISDTLYTRPSFASVAFKPTANDQLNSTVVEMLHGKIRGHQSHPIPRWSDCYCKTCTCWSSCKNTLFVLADGATTGKLFTFHQAPKLYKQ
ncbi:hypothetical protein U1Q18_019856 [Sarracenia purpurea var. burkii]